ncbi:hypothetical protein DQ384_01490 [Sphaerisporangium album]|uniref:MarR family transcriptional regulator n=1 Tax=Sphaerisporangium album TaxID=509200 RepID=A0A367FTV3_9ACTN|nr:hypothetical protein DQ384_01490 [Sphaerisporangium album]
MTGQDIGEAQGAVRALLDAVLARTGNTSEQWIALRVLASRGPMESAQAFADFMAGQPQLALDVADAAELLKGLQARGLVTEDSPRLTPAGEALNAELAEAVGPTTTTLYSAIDPADLATARNVLMQVIERANHLREEL